jgi:hypothetical protein
MCTAIEASLDSAESEKQFDRLKEGNALLAGFADVHALLARMRDKDAEPFERNRLFGELVVAAQRSDAASPLARTILLLAVSAALGGIERALRGRTGRTTGECASDLVLGFELVISRLDLKRVLSVATTLVKNTARTLEYTRKKRAAAAKQEVPLPDDYADGGYGSVAPVEPAIFGVRIASGVEDQINAVQEWMEPIIGKDDALLVTCAVVEGETAAELAERLGISEANARVRLHRALGVLRNHVPDGGAR